MAMSDVHSQTLSSAEPVTRSKQEQVLWYWRWFWRVALIVSLPIAWYCFYVPSSSIAWADNYSAAQEQAVQSGKPIILFFTGTWCVPCRIMKRNVWADKGVTASVNAAFIPVMIDVSDSNAAAVLTRHNVNSTPSTIITDPQGNVLQQKAGGMDKADFLKMLATLNPSANLKSQSGLD